jgi:hypothetical protein
MSTHIDGIVPPDSDWKKMKRIYDACIDANINVPDDVWTFFDNEEPDDSGVIIDLLEKKDVCICREWGDMNRTGHELDVCDIPKNIKTLRFYNSW